ncbi:hypothetical protein CVT24_012898 [Panaeolus cyanescens]|uniref:Uncharacterized protein n=1 Tax=Panaeolus cyanescens TaxID=181874 RepID=A0A409W2V3_9AGAR|nr:hypothetical protein CVT24_012898 [Panaeolus cyanescens]
MYKDKGAGCTMKHEPLKYMWGAATGHKKSPSSIQNWEIIQHHITNRVFPAGHRFCGCPKHTSRETPSASVSQHSTGRAHASNDAEGRLVGSVDGDDTSRPHDVSEFSLPSTRHPVTMFSVVCLSSEKRRKWMGQLGSVEEAD